MGQARLPMTFTVERLPDPPGRTLDWPYRVIGRRGHVSVRSSLHADEESMQAERADWVSRGFIEVASPSRPDRSGV